MNAGSMSYHRISEEEGPRSGQYSRPTTSSPRPPAN